MMWYGNPLLVKIKVGDNDHLYYNNAIN